MDIMDKYLLSNDDACSIRHTAQFDKDLYMEADLVH